jgi:hypothetical protein
MKTKKCDQNSLVDKRKYELTWPGLPIKYLILSTKNYIVFLDYENDLDWQTSDEFENRTLSTEQKCGYNQIKNEIDSTGSIPIGNLDEKIVIGFKIQLGEALIRAFESDFDNAHKMVMHAQDFINKRSIEQSRFMFLTSCGLSAGISAIIFLLLWLIRDSIILAIGETFLYLTLASLIGGIGALLSVILRMGNSNLDFNASKKLHYIEGSSRVVAGMISALLISLCIKTQILLPIISNIESTHLAMILGGLVAGASERFAPSIINKLDGEPKINEK